MSNATRYVKRTAEKSEDVLLDGIRRFDRKLHRFTTKLHERKIARIDARIDVLTKSIEDGLEAFASDEDAPVNYQLTEDGVNALVVANLTEAMRPFTVDSNGVVTR
jgi:hypothetical protein